MIGQDACTGTASWRLISFSMLSSILSILTPNSIEPDTVNLLASKRMGCNGSMSSGQWNQFSKSDNSTHLSIPYLTFIRTLYERKYLEQILSTIGFFSTSSNDKYTSLNLQQNNTNQNTQNNIDIGMFESVLSLCSHIGSTADGAQLLIDSGVLTCITNLPPFHNPGASLNPQIMLPSVFTTGNVTESDIEGILTPLLRLLRGMAAATSSRYVLEECARFFVRNHNSILHFFKIEKVTLRSLKIIHSVVSIICMIAESCNEPLHGGNGAHSLWESCMGSIGDVYTTALCKLLKDLSKLNIIITPN